MILLYLILYSLIAAGAIFALLVAAEKQEATQVAPWIYVACGMLWPLAALPAAGFILAGRYIHRDDGEDLAQIFKEKMLMLLRSEKPNENR